MKICGAIVLSLSSSVSADNVAIIGGLDLTGAPPYAALISSSGALTPLDTGSIQGTIQSVSMNSSGTSLIGGQEFTGSNPAYAALVSSSGTVTPLTFIGLPGLHGIIYSVAINNSGNGIIGGRDTTGPIYAALVPPSGNPLAPLTFPPLVAAGGIINTVAMNDSGNSIIGGQAFYNAQPAYAALVSSSGTVTSLTLTGGIDTTGEISSVSINSSGSGMIGGQDLTGSQPAYAALVSSSGTVTPLTLTGGGIATTGKIVSLGINSSGNGIVGGQDLTSSQPAYAALVSSSAAVTPLALTGGLATNGIINSVAINDSGNGIIGGQDFTGSQPAYAALVSPSAAVTPLALGSNMAINGTILSVAINSEGNGIVGGQDFTGSQPAYAALFMSSGSVIPLTFTGGIATTGWISSVAWMGSVLPLLSRIPTSSLSGNNLIFANYINKFAPDDAFYFVPSVMDGTLSQALESAAPTRNGISIFTASSNLFYLTTSLSNHLRNENAMHQHRRSFDASISAAEVGAFQADELSASIKLKRKPKPQKRDSTLWFEAIGALAYQKEQSQTPGFDPATGGAILAVEGKVCDHTRIGGGAAYLFTHIHEKQNAGHSNINQEDLFIYGTWENKNVYVDGSVLGGVFQISQTRNIQMTGFHFKSTSHPHGWQLDPHVEFGYHYVSSEGAQLTFNPFIMVDWANSWQHHFKEKGSGPFNAGQKSHYSSLLRSEASLRLYETIFFHHWSLIFQEKAGYVNLHSFKAGRVNAFLVGSPGTFTVNTLGKSQNLGVAELAMIFAPRNARYPTGTIFYHGEFGSKYQSHQAALELAWDF